MLCCYAATPFTPALQARSFLQLALHAPLSAVLADPQLRLSLLAVPSSESAGAAGGVRLSLRSAALGSTVELLLSSVCAALESTVPHHVLQLAEARPAREPTLRLSSD